MPTQMSTSQQFRLPLNWSFGSNRPGCLGNTRLDPKHDDQAFQKTTNLLSTAGKGEWKNATTKIQQLKSSVKIDTEEEGELEVLSDKLGQLNFHLSAVRDNSCSLAASYNFSNYHDLAKVCETHYYHIRALHTMLDLESHTTFTPYGPEIDLYRISIRDIRAQRLPTTGPSEYKEWSQKWAQTRAQEFIQTHLVFCFTEHQGEVLESAIEALYRVVRHITAIHIHISRLVEHRGMDLQSLES